MYIGKTQQINRCTSTGCKKAFFFASRRKSKKFYSHLRNFLTINILLSVDLFKIKKFFDNFSRRFNNHKLFSHKLKSSFKGVKITKIEIRKKVKKNEKKYQINVFNFVHLVDKLEALDHFFCI